MKEKKKMSYLLKILLKTVFSCAGLWAFMEILLAVGGAVLTSVQVGVFADFADKAAEALGCSGLESMGVLITPIFWLLVILAAEKLIPRLNQMAALHLVTGLRGKFRTSLTDKVSKISYRYIEDKESWDLIFRVFHQPDNQYPENTVHSAYQNILSLLRTVGGMAGVLLILAGKVWWAAVLIILLFIPVFYIAKKSGEEIYQVERDLAETKRRMEYDGETLMNRNVARERSLFGFTQEVNRRYAKDQDMVRRVELKQNKLIFLRRTNLSNLLGIIVSVMIVILLVSLQQGGVTVGLFISMTTALRSMVGEVVYSALNETQQLTRDLDYMADVDTLYGLEELWGIQDEAGDEPRLECLTVRNLRFSYQGSTRPILDGLSMEFRKGKHYAIVGINGAGKTTLTKLLLGLYEDYEGEILFDGRELKTLSAAEKKAYFSIVYQDFVRYQLTVEENISFGDERRRANAEEVLETIGLKEEISKLPKGIHTRLGRLESEGADLSGGQWQKVAIARALVHQAPICILDEPTAALDPMSESEVYREFNRISSGKTTIVISHRLGSARSADEIYLIDRGQVREHGSHEELMEENGIYAAMYEAQRSWYL